MVGQIALCVFIMVLAAALAVRFMRMSRQLRRDELLRRPFVAERAGSAHELAQQLDLMVPARLDRTAQVHTETVAHSGA